MPLVLPGTLRTATERPHARAPWVWLWDLEVERRTKTLPPVVFLFNSTERELLWPPTSGGAAPARTFYPFPFDQTEIEQTQEGDLPALDLALDNTARTLMRYLHSGRGFEGNRATLYLTHADALLAPVYPNEQAIRFDFVVASAVASETSVTLRLEQPNFFQVRVPADRFVARRCRWKFGSPECGYPVTAVAAFTDCNKTIDDCIERGEDEAFRRLPVLHPRRFGGFPGIPTQRGPR
jgi:phage-related protein